MVKQDRKASRLNQSIFIIGEPKCGTKYRLISPGYPPHRTLLLDRKRRAAPWITLLYSLFETKNKPISFCAVKKQ
jgi:hypothetical protein